MCLFVCKQSEKISSENQLVELS